MAAGNGPAEAGSTGAGAPAEGPGEPSRRARLLTLWSWLMLPGLIVSFGVGFAVGVTLMGVLDVPQGDLLAAAGLAGRLAALLVLLIGVAPTVGGVVLGRKALRAGAGGAAKGALIVHSVVLIYLVMVQLVQQVTV